jgi:hypothetical protein
LLAYALSLAFYCTHVNISANPTWIRMRLLLLLQLRRPFSNRRL